MSNLTYKECCQVYRQQIIDRFEPAKKIDNFFSDSEIEQLQLYQFQKSKKVKFRPTSANIQPNVNLNQMFIDLPWMQQKFEQLFKCKFSNLHSGNYYITTQPHDHHVDLPSEEETGFDNLIPFKSVIIPLFLTYNTVASTAFFKQRRIDYSITFDRDYQTDQKDSLYQLARTYDGLIDQYGNTCDPEKNYGNWSQEKYPHITENNLRGFEEETILDYEVGSLMVFDACQVHASIVIPSDSAHIEHTGWMKNGMNIQFYLEHERN